MEKDWRIDIALSSSNAVFRGHVGPNKLHSHWASQLTIALDDAVEFEVAGSSRTRAKAIYLSSNVPHQLFSGFVCSIYLDPLSDSRIKKLSGGSTDGWAALTEDELPQELRSLTASTDLRALVDSDLLSARDPIAAVDDRFHHLASRIAALLREGRDPDRDALARMVHLSPTRFSHWFVEQSGIPLRSYKKWLRLRMAMDALLEGERPTSAAMLGGFSDLAHMSRAFSESFGLTYMDALHAWQAAQKK